MINDDANQVPIFVLQDEPTCHHYLHVEPWNQCAIISEDVNLVCDVVAWCFKYKIFYLGMSCKQLMQFELEKLKYLYSERMMFYRSLLYQISLNGDVHIFTRELF